MARDERIHLDFPSHTGDRGPGYWLKPSNLWASRRAARVDHSNEWRYAFEAQRPPAVARSVTLGQLLGARRPADGALRFIVVGDTGEGDHSQYGLVPLMRNADPQFMIVNGDVAYPAGRYEDFIEGFFRPYSRFDCPVWATAGNHEYYSRKEGGEHYEIFCTRKHAALWGQHGLRLVPQPGMFWELRDETTDSKLVIIGLDSGKSGNLDGHSGVVRRFNPFASSRNPDTKQHEWLDWRLRLADERQERVIVLFHIPGLVSQKHDKKTHLGELHRVLSRHPSVRLVVCGHIHNHQQYDPQTFRNYVNNQYFPGAGQGAQGEHPAPHYIVSGNGGATVDGTKFKTNDFPATDAFPDHERWLAYADLGRKIVDRTGADKTVLSRVFSLLKKHAVAKDGDTPQLLSFLLIDVVPQTGAAATISVSLVALDDLVDIYSQQLDGAHVDVTNPKLVDDDALQKTTKHLFDL